MATPTPGEVASRSPSPDTTTPWTTPGVSRTNSTSSQSIWPDRIVMLVLLSFTGRTGPPVSTTACAASRLAW